MKKSYKYIFISAIFGIIAIAFDQLSYQQEKQIVKIEEKKNNILFKKEYNFQLFENLLDVEDMLFEIFYHIDSNNLDDSSKSKIHEEVKSKLLTIFSDLENDLLFDNIKPKEFESFINSLRFSSKNYLERENDQNTIFHKIFESTNAEDIVFHDILEETYNNYFKFNKEIPDLNKELNNIRSNRQKFIILSMASNVLSIIGILIFFRSEFS